MKCLVFLVVMTIVYQITATPSHRRRRGYVDHNQDHSIVIGGYENPLVHPPWSRGENIGPRPRNPHGPYGSYESFEISHGELSDTSSETSEEDLDVTRHISHSHSPGYGGPTWWRPQHPPPPSGNNKQKQRMLCIKACSVTDEFNPVCGSNNLTYPNLGRLECEKKCGVNVQLSKPTPCSVPPSNVEEENPIVDVVAACIRNCPVTTEYNPVCGTNNVTYPNQGRLLCDKYCGIPVELSKLSSCSSAEPSSQRPWTVEEQKTCLRSCPVTSEYNPVCGSNDVTYTNPGRLECAQFCRVAVTVKKKGACGSSEPDTSTDSSLPIKGLAAACMRSCPVTSEYNPVCGSNNVTYSNAGRLECAQKCGVEVTCMKKGSCGSSEATTSTEGSLTIEGFAAVCMRSCPVTSEYNPVCGSNNVTYTNPGRLECAQNCGVAVKLVRQTACEAPIPDKENNSNDEGEPNKDNIMKGVINGNNNNEENNNGQSNLDGESIDSSEYKGRPGFGDNNSQGGKGGNNGNNNCKGASRKPPSVKEVMACMQTCSLTSESNPVCGTDSITYMNPGRLLCAQFCGVDVKVKKFAPCDSTSMTNVHCPTTCTNPPVTENPGPASLPVPVIESCLEACPASLELNPVCASNNITYRNLEKLQCARRCGLDVSLKRNGPCSAPEIKAEPKDNATLILECIEQCSVPQKYEPVCGSNNITYNNTGHLICARQCGLDIQIIQSQACSTDTSSTTEKVHVNPGGLNFTIDPSILDSIWGTTAPTPPKDEDEDFELDQRVRDQ